MVKDNTFITIQAWMRTRLNLNGNELLTYAIIYGFSQDGISTFKGSRQYLADWCGCTVRCMQDTLNSLVEKQLIIKTEKEVNNIKLCEYAVKLEGSEKISYPSENISPPGEKIALPGENISPNNINNNINDNIINTVSYDTNLESLLIPKTKSTYQAILNKDSETIKKVSDPDNTRKYQNLVEFINSLNYNENTKAVLLKWYNAVGVGKVTIKMLKDKIRRLYETVKTEDEAYEAFNTAYINGWLAFYPPRKNVTYNNKATDPMYQEQKQVTEDMKAKNKDGSLMVF